VTTGFRYSAAVLAIALAPTLVAAQQRNAGALPAEAGQILAEIQTIQQQLEPIHRRAMADRRIQESQEALSSEIQTAMVRIDPSLPAQVERFAALEREMAAAQAQQDRRRIEQITAEARGIQERLERAQAQVLQQPAIGRRMESFQAELMAGMKAIDPQAERLVTRLAQLDSRLRTVMAQAR
jgi:chromosome segregation ATPase